LKNYVNANNQRRIFIMRRLHHTLTYAGSSAALFVGYPIIGYFIVLIILNVTAIIYAPYLIKTLIRLKKWRWIIAFGIMVIIPAVLVYLISYQSIYRSVFAFIPLLMFYIFCWILRFSIPDWIEKIECSEMNFDE
jgi:nitrogen fixation/metabolism regulation signal transduction histidine kinase